MDQVDAAEPWFPQVIGSEPGAGAALRRHRPLSVGADQDRDHARGIGAGDGEDLDAQGLNLAQQPPPAVIVADSGDEPNRRAEGRGPGTEVGRLPAAPHSDHCRVVVIGPQPSRWDDGDVEDEVANRQNHRRPRIACNDVLAIPFNREACVTWSRLASPLHSEPTGGWPWWPPQPPSPQPWRFLWDRGMAESHEPAHQPPLAPWCPARCHRPQASSAATIY